MRTSVDTNFYISTSEHLINGQFPSGRELFYVSYITVLAVLSILGLPLNLVIYVHFIAEIAAIICCNKLAKNLTQNDLTALVAPLAYILWFKFQQWNLIIYTDALFSHMVVISIFALHQAKSRIDIIGATILILFSSFLRPTGLGLMFSAVIYFGVIVYNKIGFRIWQKLILLTIGLSSFTWLVNYALGNFIDSFINSYQMAEIIYPKISFLVEPSTLLYIPEIKHEPIIRLILFIFKNPIYFLKISVIKGMLYVSHLKPYYSLKHNIFIAGFLYPLYFFAFLGSLKMKKNITKATICSFVIFQILIVSFTSENWDGRFLLPILPLIFILSSVGIDSISRKLGER